MKNKEPFDFERFKEEAMEGLYKGKKMGGTDGVFAPMLKHLLESMLEGELDNHLQESKSSSDPNRRNGKTKKNVRSLQSGEFELESTRDRNGTFEPKIVAKRQLIITDELEENVIAMYARGMSTRNISDYVKEMYAMEISATEISNITDRIIPAMNGEPDLWKAFILLYSWIACILGFRYIQIYFKIVLLSCSLVVFHIHFASFHQ